MKRKKDQVEKRFGAVNTNPEQSLLRADQISAGACVVSYWSELCGHGSATPHHSGFREPVIKHSSPLLCQLK